MKDDVISLDKFHASNEMHSLLEQTLKDGARFLLQQAIENEVNEYPDTKKNMKNSEGRKQFVRNGYLPERELQTGMGPISVKQSWEEEYKNWNKRCLEGKRYVYIWVDGIYFNVRLGDDRICFLVILGALADGTKELVAIHNGYRESKISRIEVLENLKRRGLHTAIEDVNVVKSGKKALNAVAQEETCLKELEKAKNEQEMAQEAGSVITEKYHPFELETGVARKGDQLTKELSEAYGRLESIVEQAQCTDNQKKKLKKSRGMVGTFITLRALSTNTGIFLLFCDKVSL